MHSDWLGLIEIIYKWTKIWAVVIKSLLPYISENFLL